VRAVRDRGNPAVVGMADPPVVAGTAGPGTARVGTAVPGGAEPGPDRPGTGSPAPSSAVGPDVVRPAGTQAGTAAQTAVPRRAAAARPVTVGDDGPRWVVDHRVAGAVDRATAGWENPTQGQRARVDSRLLQSGGGRHGVQVRGNPQTAGRDGQGHHSAAPGWVKYQKAEENHTTVSRAVSSPPSTGSDQPGSPRSRSDSIFAANAP
jgi:hypothetical protein